MSKKDKAEKTATEKTPAPNSPSARAAAAASFKFGVPHIASKMGVKEASARVALRKHKVAKAEGGVYGWNKESEVEEVLKKISSRVSSKKVKAAAAADKAGAEKGVKKMKVKKAA
jgi:hypothetical protein